MRGVTIFLFMTNLLRRLLSILSFRAWQVLNANRVFLDQKKNRPLVRKSVFGDELLKLVSISKPLKQILIN